MFVIPTADDLVTFIKDFTGSTNDAEIKKCIFMAEMSMRNIELPALRSDPYAAENIGVADSEGYIPIPADMNKPILFFKQGNPGGQQNSQTGQLNAPNTTDRSVGDWKLDCVQLFKDGKIREARTLICQQSTPEEADEIFRWMYDNLDLWSTDPHKQDQAIVIIRNGLVNVPLVADQEINLSATLCELSNL
jgi:hypothetical protein